MTKYATFIDRTVCCPTCGLSFIPSADQLKVLTLKQRNILDFLETYASEFGCMPSFQEIADKFGYLSLATVHEHLTNLERKGYIRRAYNATRAIVLTGEAR